MKELIELASAEGILVVTASGNITEDNYNIDYPAAYPEVIAVSNVDNFSLYVGDSVISELNELAAPGQNIVGLGTPIDGSDYVTMSGTSQSTPHVVGIAALLMEKYPNESAEQIRLRMQEKALDLGEPGRDDLYGYGLVQYSVAEEVEEEPETPEEDDEPEDETSDESEGTDETEEESEQPEDIIEDEGSDSEESNVADDTSEEDSDTDEASDNGDEDEGYSEEELESDSESNQDSGTNEITRSTVWIRPSESNGMATISDEDIESVADDGVLAVSFDSSLSHINRITLSPEHIQELQERNITLLVARVDMEWVIPSSNLSDGSALLIFEPSAENLDHIDLAKNLPISFSIEQNGERQAVFPSHMTYRFFTNGTDTMEDYLYAWDETEREWILLGDTFTNGGVVGTSNSTATLAVFNPDELSASINQLASNEADDDPQAVEQPTEESDDETVETVEESSLDLPVALSGAVVILAAVSGGFYFFGGKTKE